MIRTKAGQIAAHLNAYCADRPYDFKEIAEGKATEINVGLYWIGTASGGNSQPQVEVWQTNVKGTWTRKLGTVTLGYDNIWRS